MKQIGATVALVAVAAAFPPSGLLTAYKLVDYCLRKFQAAAM